MAPEGCQHRQPAQRSDAGPVRSDTVTFASRLGLGQPLHRPPPSSRTSGAPSDKAEGQRALPRLQHYYELSDSSEGIGSHFPIRVIATPTDRVRSDDRATHGQPVTQNARRRHHGLLGTYEVSLDHFMNNLATARRNHPQRPPHLGRSNDAVATSVSGIEETGSSASLFAGRSPPHKAFHRFTQVQACGFASAPSAPPVTRTH